MQAKETALEAAEKTRAVEARKKSKRKTGASGEGREDAVVRSGYVESDSDDEWVSGGGLLFTQDELIHSVTRNGHAPIHIAARCGGVAKTKTKTAAAAAAPSQIDAGADRGDAEPEGDSSAASKQQPTEASRLSRHNAQKYAAAQLRGVKMVVMLCNKGADVDARTRGGDTALHIAAQEGSTAMAICLLDLGASHRDVNRLGQIALHRCVMRGHADTSLALLKDAAARYASLRDHPAQLVNLETTQKWTALTFAVRAVSHDEVSGEKTNSSGGNGAVDAGSKSFTDDKPNMLDFLRALCKHEPDPEVLTTSGLTPLLLAASDGALAAAAVLLDNAGADPNAQNDQGFAPLHAAARSGNCDLISLLLSRKADLAIEDVEGWTSLHFACQAGNVAAVQLLLELGGEEFCGIKNVAGEVAARVAFKWGKIEVVELIASFEQWWQQGGVAIEVGEGELRGAGVEATAGELGRGAGAPASGEYSY